MDNFCVDCGKIISKKAQRCRSCSHKKYHKEHPGVLSGQNNPFYGKYHLQETKQKMSENKKGDKNPTKRPEVAKKISESMKGERHPMYGKYHTEQTKQKQSESHKGERNSFYGKHHTEESKRKNSESNKGKPSPNKGKHPSKETRKKQSDAHKGKSLSEEHKKKISKTMNGKQLTEEHLRKLMQSNGTKPNKKELELNSLLQEILLNEYKLNVKMEVMTIAGKIPDFVNINGQKKLIELFGDYWHQNDNPQNRIDLFKQYGWDCLIIWEHELENKEQLVEKILNFHSR